jgi:hypothetical protein
MTASTVVPALPEGFTTRPLTLEDAQSVFEAVGMVVTSTWVNRAVNL